MSLLLLLVSPVLTAATPVELQLFNHGSQPDGASSALYANGQQVAVQGVKLVVVGAPNPQLPKAESGPNSPSAAETEAPLNTPAEPSQVSTDGGYFALFLQQNGESGQILIILRDSAGGTSPSTFQVTAQLPRGLSDAARKRSRFRIVVEILEALKDGPLTPYELGFRLRLNDKRAKEYLETLEKEGLVERVTRKGRTAYLASATGNAFVGSLKLAFQKRGHSPMKDDRYVFSDLL